MLEFGRILCGERKRVLLHAAKSHLQQNINNAAEAMTTPPEAISVIILMALLLLLENK